MTKLKPFQCEGVLRIKRFKGRALLADEQGLGKTIQALKWILKAKLFPAVVVTPASLKYTWQAEASEHFNLRSEVLEGNARRMMKEAPGKITILNYDVLESWLPLILLWRPKCVVFDEAHFIKNSTAKRTRLSMKLSGHVRSVLALSGTPLTKRPIELWSILKCIIPKTVPSKEAFAWRYCRPRWTRWGWRYDGACRLKELRRNLKRTCMIRRLKRNVLPELPDKTRRAVLLKLSDRTEYDRAETDFIKWLSSINQAKANKARKSVALTRIGYLMRLAAKSRLPQTIRWIEDFLEAHPGEKLVCFTMHRLIIDELHQRFKKRSVIIDGRVVGAEREAARRRFQTSPMIQLLFGNYKAAGVGLTLTAACHVAALDLPWTPGDLLQGEDRVHRIGQNKNVTAFYLAALDTVEEKQLKVLKRNTKVLDMILNGRGNAQELNIYQELLDGFGNKIRM